MLKPITLLLALAATTVQATELPTIKAYSPKVCLACIDWAEHLRQHGRVSKADADLQAAALRYHQGPDKPVVHHFLALDARSAQQGTGFPAH